MPLTAMALGDPDVSRQLSQILSELIYAMGAEIDFETALPSESHAVILNVIAVAPERGAIPNGKGRKGGHSEFWSAYNVDWARFRSADVVERLEAVARALVAAADQAPKSRIPDAVKARLRDAASAAVRRLADEPDRLKGL